MLESRAGGGLVGGGAAAAVPGHGHFIAPPRAPEDAGPTGGKGGIFGGIGLFQSSSNAGAGAGLQPMSPGDGGGVGGSVLHGGSGRPPLVLGRKGGMGEPQISSSTGSGADGNGGGANLSLLPLDGLNLDDGGNVMAGRMEQHSFPRQQQQQHQQQQYSHHQQQQQHRQGQDLTGLGGWHGREGKDDIFQTGVQQHQQHDNLGSRQTDVMRHGKNLSTGVADHGYLPQEQVFRSATVRVRTEEPHPRQKQGVGGFGNDHQRGHHQQPPQGNPGVYVGGHSESFM